MSFLALQLSHPPTWTFVPIAVFIGVVGAIGVYLVARAFVPADFIDDVELVEGRIRAYRGSEAITPEELEMQLPFVDRVVRPALARLAEAVTRRTPQAAREDLERQLSFLGHPLGLAAGDLIALRYVLGFVLLYAGVGLAFLFTGANVLAILLFAVIGAVVGFFFPILVLRQMARTRRRLIEKQLPTALDLLSVSVEAGLSFDVSLQHVADQMTNEIGQEFKKAIEETRLGRPRNEALEEIARRAEVSDLQSFVQAIIQSQQLGTPIGQILRQQSAELRRRRLQRARERGARATLKMLLPMAGCIFPTIWVILLAPALLVVLKTCGGA
ncbi:MAG TPA: type II secretion system F family protein [Candidatus Dormibacteraeota bacterium]